MGAASISYTKKADKISCLLYSGLTGTGNEVEMTFNSASPKKDGSGTGNFFETFQTKQGATDAILILMVDLSQYQKLTLLALGFQVVVVYL